MARVTRILGLLLPGALAVLAALAIFRPGVMPDVIEPYIPAAAILVLLLSIFVGWYYNRSRIVFTLIWLSVADLTLRWLETGAAGRADLGGTVVGTLAVLLPLNLAAYSSLSERGPLLTQTPRRLIPILGQIIAVGLIVGLGWLPLGAWLDHRWLDVGWLSWTAVPQAGLAAFGAAMLFLVIRLILRRDPVDAGLVWTLTSAFAALHGLSRGWAPTAFFATGGWVLIGSLSQTGSNGASHDALTGLSGRDALIETLLQQDGRYILALVSVDHFSRLKHTFDPEVNDQVLRMVATQLRHIPGAAAFRYRRGTFAVLFDKASAGEAVLHLDTVRRAIASYCFIVRGPRRPRSKPAGAAPPTGPRVIVLVTVSIGAAEREDLTARPGRVIRAAHEALYHAIRTGRNQVIAPASLVKSPADSTERTVG